VCGAGTVIRLFFRTMMALTALALCGCAARLPPLPLVHAPQTAPLGIPYSRYYPDTDIKGMEELGRISIERERRTRSQKGDGANLPTAHFLAISGGGDNGAFGAGLLCGWSTRGDRPEFRLVTGVSTGALSAPFAFLGPDYDLKLEQVYTQTTAADIFVPRGKLFAALAADAMTDTAPLRTMISGYVDRRMITRIAEEYAKGRLLLILTTNLDQGRPVIWNIGAIAESDHPQARDLIIDILVASSAIPGIFPPVMMTVTHDGKVYEEMHVDGGTMAQSFLYPPNLSLERLGRREGASRKRVAYIIRNGRLFRDEAEIPRQTLSVAAQAASTMIAANGSNDAFRMYLTTRRDGVDFNFTYIDDDFTEPWAGPFDQAYMTKLFEYGYQLGHNGKVWKNAPPGFAN
jgi:hypothetical protein